MDTTSKVFPDCLMEISALATNTCWTKVRMWAVDSSSDGFYRRERASRFWQIFQDRGFKQDVDVGHRMESNEFARVLAEFVHGRSSSTCP